MFYELSNVQVYAVLSNKTAASILVTDIRDKMCWWQLGDVGDNPCHQDGDFGVNI